MNRAFALFKIAMEIVCVNFRFVSPFGSGSSACHTKGSIAANYMDAALV